jgi:hypothetical protein
VPPSSAVYVCQGKACRKPDGRDELLDDLTHVADVHMVKCQKVCKGVVVGVCLDNRLEWFARISKKKSRAALLDVIDEGTVAALPTGLAKRRVTKLSGHPPR